MGQSESHLYIIITKGKIFKTEKDGGGGGKEKRGERNSSPNENFKVI